MPHGFICWIMLHLGVPSVAMGKNIYIEPKPKFAKLSHFYEHYFQMQQSGKKIYKTQTKVSKFATFMSIISGRSRISHWGDGKPLGGYQPPTQVLFGENECEHEGIGSCWGWYVPAVSPWICQ